MSNVSYFNEEIGFLERVKILILYNFFLYTSLTNRVWNNLSMGHWMILSFVPCDP